MIEWITLDLRQRRLYVYDERHTIIPLRPELQGLERLWTPIPEGDEKSLRVLVEKLITRTKEQTP